MKCQLNCTDCTTAITRCQYNDMIHVSLLPRRIKGCITHTCGVIRALVATLVGANVSIVEPRTLGPRTVRASVRARCWPAAAKDTDVVVYPVTGRPWPGSRWSSSKSTPTLASLVLASRTTTPRWGSSRVSEPWAPRRHGRGRDDSNAHATPHQRADEPLAA